MFVFAQVDADHHQNCDQDRLSVGEHDGQLMVHSVQFLQFLSFFASIAVSEFRPLLVADDPEPPQASAAEEVGPDGVLS